MNQLGIQFALAIFQEAVKDFSHH